VRPRKIDKVNPLEERMVTGTVGELLVQLRLLEYDVQAAPPLKDSGNDLIAIRGKQFRAIQVKATNDANNFAFNHKELKEKLYDVLALVQIIGEGPNLRLDECRIYLIPKDAVLKGHYKPMELAQYELSRPTVDALFDVR
jgi:hypothetical protein